MMEERLIEFREVDLGYGRKLVLQAVDFFVKEGDFFGIVGPNGSGKTTLLRGILKVLRPQKGQIIFARPKDAKELTFGYVPQEKDVDQVFPLSVLEVVFMGRFKKLGPGRRPGMEDHRVALKSLAHVGIEGLAGASFQELSGGQKQRVLIARALAAGPHMLVLDEPTSGMDLASERHLMELIKDLHQKDRLTIILATHNLNLVANYAEKIAIVDRRHLVAGPAKEILSDERLSNLYRMNVSVREVDGKQIILSSS